MNRTLYAILVVMVVLIVTGCAPQPTPISAIVGSSAPAFTLDDALGGQTSLTDYQGAPVLLFFHMAVG